MRMDDVAGSHRRGAHLLSQAHTVMLTGGTLLKVSTVLKRRNKNLRPQLNGPINPLKPSVFCGTFYPHWRGSHIKSKHFNYRYLIKLVSRIQKSNNVNVILIQTRPLGTFSYVYLQGKHMELRLCIEASGTSIS